jgi:outer membrane protein OmpA-like peptidoglycan-associated protein
MRKLLVLTTALSVAISPLAAMPGLAQVLNEDGSITGADGTLLCATVADPACDIAGIVDALGAKDAAAGEALQQQIDARIAAAAAAAQAEAEAAAQAAAEAEAETGSAAEAAAAQAAAEAEAAAQAAVVEAAAQAQAEAEAAAAKAAAQATTEVPGADTATEGATSAASALLAEPLPETPIEAPGEGAFAPATDAPPDAEAAAAASAALAAAEAELQVTKAGEVIDPAAGLKVAEPDEGDPALVVDAPVVSASEVESLIQLLTVDPTVIDLESIAAAATAMAPADADAATALAPAYPDALIGAVTETITEGAVRTSAQEFAAPPVMVAEGKKSGLSSLEKAGLVVLGALAVGAVVKSNNDRQEARRVVSNTGDRVVMLLPDGSYQVLKDDDAVIRQPGSTVRTETFNDGSSRTIVERGDGTQVVTIRDATGRVLRRATYDDRGREIVLIDDLQREEVVIVEDLPRPRSRIVISSKENDAALKRELAAIEAERAGRSFSLRQIRDIPQVRALAATIDVEPVTFASGSAAIAASEARNLADLGRVMQDLLELNPAELFLIEGHTDATGRAAMNLALSDRRAESVALALTEYFDIPPENMVVQGYGETELLIDTQASEPLNRRVAVRVITPLMRTAALR